MPKVEVGKELTCTRCGHRWLPRKEDVRTCPGCRTIYWDRPRQGRSPIYEVAVWCPKHEQEGQLAWTSVGWGGPKGDIYNPNFQIFKGRLDQLQQYSANYGKMGEAWQKQGQPKEALFYIEAARTLREFIEEQLNKEASEGD